MDMQDLLNKIQSLGFATFSFVSYHTDLQSVRTKFADIKRIREKY